MGVGRGPGGLTWGYGSARRLNTSLRWGEKEGELVWEGLGQGNTRERSAGRVSECGPGLIDRDEGGKSPGLILLLNWEGGFERGVGQGGSRLLSGN